MEHVSAGNQFKHVYPTGEMPHFSLSGSFCCGVQNFNSFNRIFGVRGLVKNRLYCMFLSLRGNRSGLTVQALIRWIAGRSDQGLYCLSISFCLHSFDICLFGESQFKFLLTFRSFLSVRTLRIITLFLS